MEAAHDAGVALLDTGDIYGSGHNELLIHEALAGRRDAAARAHSAHAVQPIASLQIEWSLISRGSEAGIVPTARALGVAINPHGALSRGLLSGHWSPERAARGRDFRSHLPRFTGANLDANLTLVEELRRIAEEKGATVAQLAIAWVLARGADVVPLVGARTRAQLAPSCASRSARST